jgi:hypothetical protein
VNDAAELVDAPEERGSYRCRMSSRKRRQARPPLRSNSKIVGSALRRHGC